jgi:hypothetical protein
MEEEEEDEIYICSSRLGLIKMDHRQSGCALTVPCPCRFLRNTGKLPPAPPSMAEWYSEQLHHLAAKDPRSETLLFS